MDLDISTKDGKVIKKSVDLKRKNVNSTFIPYFIVFGFVFVLALLFLITKIFPSSIESVFGNKISGVIGEGVTPTPTAPLPPSWVRYTSNVSSFTVGLPVQPTQESNIVPLNSTANVDFAIYTASPKILNTQFLITCVNYPTGYIPTDNTDSLEKMVKGSINTNPSNKLVSSNYQKFYKYNGVEYVIENTAEKNLKYSKNRIIIVKGIAYILEEESDDNTFPNYDDFVNSFHLTS